MPVLKSVNPPINAPIKAIKSVRAKPKKRCHVSDTQFAVQVEKDKKANTKRRIKEDNKASVLRYEMATGIAPIARPLKKGAKRYIMDIKQKWKGGEIRYYGAELDDTDLGVLLALLFIAQKQQPKTQPGSQIENLLPSDSKIRNLFPEEVGSEGEIANFAKQKEVVAIKASYTEIRQLLGIKGEGKSNDKTINECLLHLSTIVVYFRKGKDNSFTHLIQSGRGRDGKLDIALSYRLTASLLGLNESNYGAIDFNLFNSLSKGTARILYVFLASWYGAEKKARKIGMDKLISHVYSDKLSVMSDELIRIRKFRIKKALTEIALHSKQWTFEYEENIVNVNYRW